MSDQLPAVRDARGRFLKVVDFSLDIGVEHAQYWQGAGTAYTEYDHVAVGVASELGDAIDDALDGVAQADEKAAEYIEKTWKSAYPEYDKPFLVCNDCEGEHTRDEYEVECEDCEKNIYAVIRW